MKPDGSLTSHYLIRAAIMAGLSYYIVHLVRTDSLIYYIAPRMQNYVKYAAIVLIALAVQQAYMAVISLFSPTAPACDCDHEPPRSIWLNTVIYSLFVLPLLLGFLLPNSIMASHIVSIKGMNLSTGAANSSGTGSGNSSMQSPSLGAVADDSMPENPSARKQELPNEKQSAELTDEELLALFETDDYNADFAKLAVRLYRLERIEIKEEGFMEVLTAVDLFKEHFVGKTVEISGFVYRAEDMKSDQFAVARLAISCCAADASPYGIMVESALSSQFAEDEWIKLEGTIGMTTYNDVHIMKLDATKVEKIPAPETPYVYPDYTYFDDWD